MLVNVQPLTKTTGKLSPADADDGLKILIDKPSTILDQTSLTFARLMGLTIFGDDRDTRGRPAQVRGCTLWKDKALLRTGWSE